MTPACTVVARARVCNDEPTMSDAGPEVETVSVLVVDDQAPFRLAARAVIKRTDGFELAGEAESGEAAVEMAAELHPDLVLMDINMPGINGIEATSRIVAEAPDAVVFLCSTYERSDLPEEAVESGARAYINKEELGPVVLRDLWELRQTSTL